MWGRIGAIIVGAVLVGFGLGAILGFIPLASTTGPVAFSGSTNSCAVSVTDASTLIPANLTGATIQSKGTVGTMYWGGAVTGGTGTNYTTLSGTGATFKATYTSCNPSSPTVYNIVEAWTVVLTYTSNGVSVTDTITECAAATITVPSTTGFTSSGLTSSVSPGYTVTLTNLAASFKDISTFTNAVLYNVSGSTAVGIHWGIYSGTTLVTSAGGYAAGTTYSYTFTGSGVYKVTETLEWKSTVTGSSLPFNSTLSANITVTAYTPCPTASVSGLEVVSSTTGCGTLITTALSSTSGLDWSFTSVSILAIGVGFLLAGVIATDLRVDLVIFAAAVLGGVATGYVGHVAAGWPWL